MSPLLCLALSAFAVLTYVLADGSDLGVGILCLLAPRDVDRDIMMKSIEPVWDGHETWLVFGGVTLFAFFPMAYHVLLPALYLPVLLMLLSLVLRGVACSFRRQAVRYRRIWDFVFSGGSLFATAAQGLILGGIIGGVPMLNGVSSGGPFAFLNVLGILSALGLIGGYALMGASSLICKTRGATRVFGREVARAALTLTALMLILVSSWTALTEPHVSSRWFAWPNWALFAILPLGSAVTIVALWRSFWGKREASPLQLTMLLFVLGFAGLAVSIWPYIVPYHVTIWEGAADPKSRSLAGLGAIIIIPIILGYQFRAYWVSRGKTVEESTPDAGGPPLHTRRTSSQTPGLHLS